MRTQQQIRDALGVAIQVGDIVTIQGAKILWPNFRGAKDQFNSEGDRNFNIHLTKQQTDELTADGWNVKCKAPRPDDEEQVERCTLKITVNMEGPKPPKIIGVGANTRKRNEYTKETVELVDAVEMRTCDISFVPYFWEVGDSIGVSAYLRTMYFELVEDELDEKWAELING